MADCRGPAPSSELRLLAMCAAVLGGSVACNRQDNQPKSEEPAGAPSGPVIARQPSSPGRLPADLDPPSLLREMGCPGSSARGLRAEACRIVHEFSQAETPDSFPGIGQVVWYGQCIALSAGGQPVRLEHCLLQCRPGRGRTTLGSKAVMEYSVAMRTAIPESVAPPPEAQALVVSLRSHSLVPNTSRLVEWAKTVAPEEGFQGLVRTDGASLHFRQLAGEYYLRQQGDRWLLLVRQPGTTQTVELWPVP